MTSEKKTSKINKSKVGASVSDDVVMPVCSCGLKLEQVRYMDYGNIRVIFHTGVGCIVGTIPVPEFE